MDWLVQLRCQFSSVQLLSRVWHFATPWTAARQASLSITSSQSLLKLMSIESVMPFNLVILCHSLLLLPSIFPSIRLFSNNLALHIRWPKYWSFRFNISSSNEYSGLISFRMDWLDLLAVQGTLKSLLQHHSSKASILWCSVFFTVQLSHPYMTTGKTIALTRWTFVGKVMSLLLYNYFILCHSLLLCLQSFPASGSFPTSQLFRSGGQSIGVSASASVLWINIQGCTKNHVICKKWPFYFFVSDLKVFSLSCLVGLSRTSSTMLKWMWEWTSLSFSCS